MRRIKHRDLTHYFLEDHRRLPRAYVASCEKFFRTLGKKVLSNKRQASSDKRQALSQFRMILINNNCFKRQAIKYLTNNNMGLYKSKQKG